MIPTQQRQVKSHPFSRFCVGFIIGKVFSVRKRSKWWIAFPASSVQIAVVLGKNLNIIIILSFELIGNYNFRLEKC